MSKPVVNVAAGLILRPDGGLLLAERPGDKPWSGWWELPGGKIEPGETVLQALARELFEELGIRITEAAPWVTHVHEYPKNIVSLAFCRVTGWEGTPTGVEGQTLAWVDPHGPLDVGPLLPATEPPLRWLQLPDRYLLTSIGGPGGLAVFLSRLESALRDGIRLVQFREPEWAAQSPGSEIHAAFRLVLQCCRQAGALCLVNSVHPESWWEEADGVHLRAADARARAAQAPARTGRDEAAHGASDGSYTKEYALTRSSAHLQPRRLLAVSAHTAQDLAAARALDADFAVLGHVLDTPSHPDTQALGWEGFARLAEQAGLPVYAIGGQSPATQRQAWRHGAHGIAGIRHLLPGG